MARKIKHLFSLRINLNSLNTKYGFPPEFREEIIPENTTKIEKIKQDENISFLDETKRSHKCSISMIDFSSGKELGPNTRYYCFWDKNPLPEGVVPIGCPLRYIPDRTTKNYHSEITKEHYTISENVSENRFSDLEKKKDSRFSLDRKGYYETDGIFCSFNCCMAFVEDPDNKKNPIYRFSRSLLLKIYSDIKNIPYDENLEIMPAPHWRTLKIFGGTFDIENFRKTFNTVLVGNYGTISFTSLGKVFQHQIKF